MRNLKQVPGWLTLINGTLLLLTLADTERYTVRGATPVDADTNAPPQSAQAADIRQVAPGMSIERELSGGSEHQYQIALAAGRYVRFQIVKHGVDITLTVQGPTGERLFTANFDAREQGVETLSLVAQAAGTYTVIVQSDYPRSPLGRYQVKIDELREATSRYQERFTAQQTFVEAIQLFKKETAEAQSEALKELSESLALWQSVGDQEWEARVVFWMGWIKLGLNKHAEALDHLNRALELRRAAGDTTGEGETLRTIGMVYLAQAKNQQALDYLDRALGLHKQSAERGQLAFTYTQLGALYWRLGEREKMRDSFDRGLDALREIGDIENETRVLTSLSFIHLTQGDYQKALDNLPRTLELFRAAKSLDGEAATLNTLGMVYYNLGDPSRALDYFNESLSCFNKLQYKRNQAYVLTNVGITYSTLGDKQKALDQFDKALQLTRAAADPRGEANLLRHIGKVYQEIGNLPVALNNFERMLELSREQSDPSSQARALTSIGEVYAAMGDHLKALASLDLALTLVRKVKERYGEAKTLSALAGVQRSRGDLASARTFAEEALRIIESLRAKVTGNELRTSYLAVNQGYYELYVDLLMRLHEQYPESGYDALALQASERARARALLESLVEAKADIRQGVDSTLLERERSLQLQLNANEERRVRLLSAEHTPEQAAAAERQVNAMLTQYQQVQAQIRATSPRYAALTQPQPLDLKEIQAQLDEETLLLVYGLGAKRSFVWAVTPTTLTSYVLPARDKINSRAGWVARMMKASSQPQSRAQTEEAVRHLSRLVLGPVAARLSVKRLVIVADGALQSIPFAALPAPNNKQLLIAEHEIVNLPSVSVLSQQRRQLAGRAPAPLSLAIIADPVFEMDDERFQSLPAAISPVKAPLVQRADPLAEVTRSLRAAGLPRFGRLLASRQEAEQISKHFPEAVCSKILDFDASRANLARINLSEYRILHFATHSLINLESPELSGIVLSLYDKERQPQDGFLRAHELYNLKLGADLVVLSACQTALGKEVRGEGLINLTRGFMYAGVARLVVSLWDVSDNATAELMRRFYEGMTRDNLRPAAALRNAQLAMARQPRWSARYYWAGFILQGEWR